MYVAQAIFVNINASLFPRLKCRPNYWATSAIFKKLPKVNNQPMGEKSANLVTLFGRVLLVRKQ
jgi:hypothetical protein